MLYFLGIWILLLIGCGAIGTGILNGMRADNVDRVGDRVIVSVWLGMVMLAIGLLAVSLLMPLSPLVGIGVMLGLAVLALRTERSRTEWIVLCNRLTWRRAIGFLGLALLVAALTSQQVIWLDTGLYHYQMVRWLADFGTVPGVALLFGNFGFTSSWFAFAAPWNPVFLGSRVSAVGNGFVLLIAILQVWVCLSQIGSGQGRLSDRFMLVFLGVVLPVVVGIPLLSEILVSPSPDIPVIFLIGVVGWTVLLVFQYPHLTPVESATNPVRFNAQAIPLLLSVGAVTIKLTTLPLLLVSGLFYVVGQGYRGERLLRTSIIVGFLLLPFISAGITTSGCPLYPSSLLCLDLPWSPTSESIELYAAVTHSWTSWYGPPPAGINPWLWLLWNWLLTSRLNQLMAVLSLLSGAIAVYIIKTLPLRQIQAQLWVVLLGISGIVFLMLTSPVFRFGLAYLILIPAWLLANYAPSLIKRVLPRSLHKISAGLHSQTLSKKAHLSLLVGGVCLVIVWVPTWRWFLPPPMQEMPFSQQQVNDIVYFVPQSLPDTRSLCWAIELPCAFEVTPDTYLRDPKRGLAAGFIRRR